MDFRVAVELGGAMVILVDASAEVKFIGGVNGVFVLCEEVFYLLFYFVDFIHHYLFRCLFVSFFVGEVFFVDFRDIVVSS